MESLEIKSTYIAFSFEIDDIERKTALTLSQGLETQADIATAISALYEIYPRATNAVIIHHIKLDSEYEIEYG